MSGEFTTVYGVKNLYLNSLTNTTDDGLLYSLVQQVTRQIRYETNRNFLPTIATKYYDYPGNGDLLLDDDLVSVTSILNGDGTALTAGQYKLLPINATVKYSIVALSSQIRWVCASDGSVLGVITVTGQWGWSLPSGDDWEVTGAALAAAITTTTATSATCTTGIVHKGDFIKIDSEWLYVSAVSTGASDTLTLIRGANGSTAATHLINAPISRWVVDPGIEMLARQCVAAYYKQRSNPGMETVVIDGTTFNTPRDIQAYIRSQVEKMGLIRTGI